MIAAEDFQSLQGLGRGIARSNVQGYYDSLTPENISLSQMIAERVCGVSKQDVTMFLEGPKGSGKSYLSLSLAYGVAEKIAEKRGGSPGDYFSLDNMAIIEPQQVYDIMRSLEDYNVYILDDIGVGWNARDFSKKGNKMMNDIFEICRVKRTVIILSAPAGFLIDKVPRELVTYYGEVSGELHDWGYSTLKLKTPLRKSNLNKTIFPFLTLKRNRITRFMIDAPPREISDQYDVKREEVTNRLIESHAEEMMAEAADANPQEQLRRAEQKAKFWEAYHLHINEGISKREASRRVGMSDNTFRQCEKEYCNA